MLFRLYANQVCPRSSATRPRLVVRTLAVTWFHLVHATAIAEVVAVPFAERFAVRDANVFTHRAAGDSVESAGVAGVAIYLPRPGTLGAATGCSCQ